MKRIDLHTAAGVLALSDAQYDRHLHLRDLRGIWPEGDPQAQTEADWQASRDAQAQGRAGADALSTYPERQR